MQGLTVNGWAVSPAYANQLKAWVADHPDQFDDDERPRAARAAAYLARRAVRPHPRGNVAGLRAAILTAITLSLMLTPTLTLTAAFRDAAVAQGYRAELMEVPAAFVAAPVLVLIATAVTSARLPTWLRVILFIIGLFNCFFIVIVWPVTMGQIGGDAGLSVICALGALVTLIVAISIGGRR